MLYRVSSSRTSGFRLLCPAPRVGGIKRWCASDVCLSVAYIGPKSRTERPRKTKIGTEVAHVTCDSDTAFKVRRSKINLQGSGAYCGGLPHSLLVLNSFIKNLSMTKSCYIDYWVNVNLEGLASIKRLLSGCDDTYPGLLTAQYSVQYCRYISERMVWYGILGFNVPLDTV